MTFWDYMAFRFIESAIGFGIMLFAFPLMFLAMWMRHGKARKVKRGDMGMECFGAYDKEQQK